jgi:hypothetical protein
VLGWYVDFGKNGFPVQSDFSFNTATYRLIYVSGFDQDPIKGDSLAWKWQTVGDLSYRDCATTRHFCLATGKTTTSDFRQPQIMTTST